MNNNTKHKYIPCEVKMVEFQVEQEFAVITGATSNDFEKQPGLLFFMHMNNESGENEMVNKIDYTTGGSSIPEPWQ